MPPSPAWSCASTAERNAHRRARLKPAGISRSPNFPNIISCTSMTCAAGCPALAACSSNGLIARRAFRLCIFCSETRPARSEPARNQTTRRLPARFRNRHDRPGRRAAGHDGWWPSTSLRKWRCGNIPVPCRDRRRRHFPSRNAMRPVHGPGRPSLRGLAVEPEGGGGIGFPDIAGLLDQVAVPGRFFRPELALVRTRPLPGVGSLP